MKAFGAISVLLFAAAFAAAVEAGPALEARAAHLQCTIDFSKGVATDLMAAVPQAAALQTQLDKLDSDAAQLQSLASSGNASAFNSFVFSTLRLDVAAANLAIVGERVKFGQYGVSAETRSATRGQFTARRAAFSSCNSNAVVTAGRTKVAYMNSELSRWEGIASDLASKGADNAALLALVGQARTNIVSPLQAAVDSGDATGVEAALRQYCLADGCMLGSNFHFYAKANIARLNAIADAFEANATSPAGSRVASVRSKLAEAQAALDRVGSAQYSGGQKAEVWNAIAAAREQLRMLFREMKRG